MKDSKIRVDQPHTTTPRPRRPRPRGKQQDQATQSGGRVSRDTETHVDRPPRWRRMLPRARADDAESDDDAADSKLSKAERRRQRKLQRREKHQS